jgi:hypothetical protein
VPAATIAQDLLDACVAALADPPARQFVSHGPPAWDACITDQLTVHLGGTGFTQDRGGRAGMSRGQWTWVVQIVRCAPGLGEQAATPTAAALDANAKLLLGDIEEIQAAVRSDPAIFGGCAAVTFGAISPLGPSGYRAGYQWSITATQ